MQQNIFMNRRREGMLTFLRYWIGCRLNLTFMHEGVCTQTVSELMLKRDSKTA
jgi:hypothetical protein